MKKIFTKESLQNRFANILLLVASTSICIAGFEVALRIFPQYNDNLPLKITRSKFSSYIMAPNQSATSLHGNKYDINSLGLRDEEIDSPYGEILALAVGDSSTMGYGVDATERFSNVLSRTISKQPSLIKKIGCSDCNSTRILNAGHSGYASIDILGMTDYLLNLGIKPRILIVGVLVNDFGGPIKTAFRGNYGTTAPKTNHFIFTFIELFLKDLLRHSATYQFVANSIKKIDGSYNNDFVRKNKGNLSIQQKDTNELPTLSNMQNKGLNAFKKILSKSSEVNENIPVIFVHLPSYMELEDLDSDLLFPIKVFKKEVEKSKCAVFVDPSLKLINSGHERKNLYALNDPYHPSPLGHKVISDAIYEEIPKLLDSCSLK